MTVINFYYMTGGIVGSCSIIGIVLGVARSIFYSRTSGFLLEAELVHVNTSLRDIKNLLEDRLK